MRSVLRLTYSPRPCALRFSGQASIIVLTPIHYLNKQPLFKPGPVDPTSEDSPDLLKVTPRHSKRGKQTGCETCAVGSTEVGQIGTYRQ